MSFIHAHPVAAAILGGLFASGGLVAADWYESPSLDVPAISAVELPKLDGDLSDAAWKLARPVTVLTRHGGDFGGSGESTITVRALHDDHDLYLALEWDDPTRSLEYMPLYKDDGVWRRLQTDAGSASETRFFDDRIAVMLAPSGLALIGGAIHLGARPLAGAPASTTGRGLHYTAPGKLVDLWIWHAAAGAMTDRIEDGFLGPPLPFTTAQMAGTTRYLGGIGEDDAPHPVAMTNFQPAPGATNGVVLPLRLPIAQASAAGGDTIRTDAGESDPPARDGLWAVRASETVPYSSAADAALPDDAVIPGLIIDDSVKPGPYDVTGHATWAGGHWFLELRRSLEGGDKDLSIKSGMMLWFAVFDHAQSRHTYHLRPLILELD